MFASVWRHREFVAGLLIAGIGTVVGLCLWFDARVTNAARDAVLSERFLGELAKEVRPTCVFNSKGIIETDLGTADYLERIRVNLAPPAYAVEIVLDCKKHLAYAPLVACLNADLFAIQVERLAPHGWYYLMRPNSTVSGIMTEDPMDTNAVYRFKLEILH